MSINFRKLKQELTNEAVISILQDLGGELYKKSEKEIIFYSCCHHLRATEHKPKLYYYPDTCSFFCYSCGTAFDIISLIQERWNLENREFTFMEIIYYILDKAGLSVDNVQRINPVSKGNTPWKEILGKYSRNVGTTTPLTIYPKQILSCFSRTFPAEWVNEGISPEAMDFYHIGYYDLESQTTIPCYDINNNLVGIRVRNWNPEHGAKYSTLKTIHKFNLSDKQKSEQDIFGTDFKFSTNQVLYGLNTNKYNIESKKKVVITEGEKSVLKAHTWFGHHNMTVAMFGNHLNNYRRNLLLELGIDEVIIAPDYDYRDVGSPEHRRWERSQIKLAQSFSGFCAVSILLDEDGIVPYKNNVFDMSKEVYEQFYKERYRLV